MIGIKEALLSKNQSVIVDVRSPSEFEKGRVLGAVNIPLLDDEERAIVGTLYKKKGFRPAFLEGLRLVGPKLPEFAGKGIKLSKDKRVILYCWRGGMRSNSMKWLFESAKIEGVEVIEGGYKNYRRFLRENYEDAKLLVLGGYTGSGKTDVLKCMNDRVQVIDLEGLANHKGSAFGFIGEDKQPSTEHFENMLGEALFNLNMNENIWIEDESRNIGRIYLPEQLYNKLRTSPVIFLDIPKDIRIERLVKEYSNYGNDLLEKALNSIVKRIGGNNYKDAMSALDKNDYHTVADITLNYYDKAYAYGVEKREQNSVHKLKIDSGNPEVISRKVLNYQKLFLYLLLMFSFSQMSFAQIKGIKNKNIELDNVDSLSNEQDTVEELFVLKAVKFDLENIFDTIPFTDTLLTEDFPYFNVIDSKKYPIIDKGYIGSATMPIEGYQRAIGFDLGYRQFDIYRRTNNTFHITNGAIANLYFSPGADVNQFSTGAMFTKNFKDVSLNIDYSRVKNTGKYSGQNIKHTYLNFGIWHGNLNSIFNTFLNIRVYANEEYDNGGLENLDDLKEEYFTIRQQVPTKLTDAISRNDNYGLEITEYMKLPVKTSYFQPYITAKLRMSKEFYKFTDKNVDDDSVYGKLLTDKAGLRHYTEVKKYGTDVSFFARLKGKSYLKAGFALDKINLDTEPAIRESISELAFVTSGNIDFAKKLVLRWNSKLLFGQYAGNTESNLSLNYKIGLFNIKTGIEYGNYAPAVIHKQLYITGKKIYTNNFDNTQKFTFFARLNIDKIGLSVQNKWQTIDKYIYFSSELIPNQLEESLRVNILNVEERLKLGIFRFDANLYYNTSSSTKLPMPQYTAQLKLYLEGKPKFVRGDLILSSGFEFNYWDKFYNYSFNPGIGNYYVQNDLKLDNYRRLDFFLAAKVDDFRFFLRINNVLFPLTKEVPFKVINYPQSDLFWRLGVRWVFVN